MPLTKVFLNKAVVGWILAFSVPGILSVTILYLFGLYTEARFEVGRLEERLLEYRSHVVAAPCIGGEGE